MRSHIHLFQIAKSVVFIFLIPFVAQAGGNSPTKVEGGSFPAAAAAAAASAGPTSAESGSDLSRVQSIQRIGRAALVRKYVNDLRTLPSILRDLRSKLQTEEEQALIRQGLASEQKEGLKVDACEVCMEDFAFGDALRRYSHHPKEEEVKAKFSFQCSVHFHEKCMKQWDDNGANGNCPHDRHPLNLSTFERIIVSTEEGVRLLKKVEALEARYAHSKTALARLESTGTENIGGIAGLNTVPLPGGTFMMGSPTTEPARSLNEAQHEVTVRAFKPMDTHLTRAQYKEIMGRNPDFTGCLGITQEAIRDWELDSNKNKPVTCVSWNDTQEMIQKLQERGIRARRITEAEAEYLMRLGVGKVITTTPWGNERDRLGEHAWYYWNSGNQVHDVKTRQATERMFDVRGNVYTWTEDLYPGGSHRVLRGGCWNSYAQYLRSADRRYGILGYRYDYVGVRLAIE